MASLAKNVSEKLVILKVTEVIVENCGECEVLQNVEQIPSPSYCSEQNHNWTVGSAVYKLPWSNISFVEVVWMGEFVAEQTDKAARFEVCKDANDCTFCGNLFRKQYFEAQYLVCEGVAIEGNEMKVTLEKGASQICTITHLGAGLYTQLPFFV